MLLNHLAICCACPYINQYYQQTDAAYPCLCLIRICILGTSNPVPYPCQGSLLAELGKKGRKPHCECKWNKQPREKASSNLCWQSSSVLKQEGLYPLEKYKLPLSDTVEKTLTLQVNLTMCHLQCYLSTMDLRLTTDSGFLCMQCLAVLIIVLFGFTFYENRELRKICKCRWFMLAYPSFCALCITSPN